MSNVGLFAFRDQRPRIARVRIKRLEGLAGGRVYPFVIDVLILRVGVGTVLRVLDGAAP
jgi:hypothetical protein